VFDASLDNMPENGGRGLNAKRQRGGTYFDEKANDREKARFGKRLGEN
jgi:hypothetical protein